MKTKGNKKTKVNIVTLGCSKNLVDSEVLLTQLRGNGIDAVHESNDDSSVVVINTCGFIDNAKQESIDTILRYVDAKEEGVVDKVYVTGCLSQRYKDDLEKEIPEVDAWFGTRDLSRLLKVFKAGLRCVIQRSSVNLVDRRPCRRSGRSRSPWCRRTASAPRRARSGR